MKTSIATVSLAGDLEEKLAAIAKTGFNGIEVYEQDIIGFEGTARQAGNLVRDYGLSITLFQPFRNFEGMPENQRSNSFDRARRKFDLMGELQTGLLLVGSSVSGEASGDVERIADDFNQLAELAKERSIQIAYLGLAWAPYINDHLKAWEIVQKVDHPCLGLGLNSFHSMMAKPASQAIDEIPGDRIFLVQLADAPVIDMDLRYLSKHFGSMPGQGDLDLEQFMRKIAATGYSGPLSLNVTNDKFSSANPRTIAVDGYRSLLNLADHVRRLEPAFAIEIPDIPDRAEARGFEFIEFTSNDKNEARIIGTMLHAMGFAYAGHHISKAVGLWRQGNINIVINTESEGFAYSAYIMHGTSICDIGVQVDDALATLRRARAMGAKTFHQPVGAGELNIPAIRGVGGSLLHFIDAKTDLGKVWEIEFTPQKQENEPEAAGLDHIDHIAQTMNYEEMLSWTLFYTSIFKSHKSAMIDVADPSGLVHSQAISSNHGDMRITLNGSETHRTFAGQFLADNFGAPVQHVAMASNDIFKSAAIMQKNGFVSLEMPANYYDDLKSRFDLEKELIEKMQAANILYDRDEGGEYFQFYSQPFFSGFFFEILQRKGDYSGFGARNAQFRIAAQKKYQRISGIPLC